MLACHAGGPGSIPGRCSLIFFFLTSTTKLNVYSLVPTTTSAGLRVKRKSTLKAWRSFPPRSPEQKSFVEEESLETTETSSSVESWQF